MLAITETAAQAINSVVAANALPDGAGVRIAASGPEGELELSVTPQPDAGDMVVEGAGAAVFLEPTAAAVLDDKVLDAQPVNEGGQEQVRFAIAPQDEQPAG